jgi:hypothetical protein
MSSDEDLKAKLLSNIRKEPGPLDTECWIWQRATAGGGYGQISNGGRVYAHRLSYEVFVGPIPEGMLCLHRCDVPSCVNYEHLYLGTTQDNVDDMWNRGRGLMGSSRGNAVLNEEIVADILQALSEGEEKSVLADHYGVSRELIGKVARGELWGHVEGPRPRPKRRQKLSRFKGVTYLYAQRKPWYAKAHVDGRAVYLGSFCHEVDAAIAVNYFDAYHGRNLRNVIPEGEWCHD